MSHQVTWPVPHHVVMVTLTDEILAHEVQQVADDLYEVFEAETTPLVHLLIDARSALIQDKLWNYSKLNLRRHPRCGISVVIGDSRLGGLVIAIFSKLLNASIHYSATEEDAMRILSQRDVAVAAYRG